MQNKTGLETDAHALKEMFFECGMEILRPINYMIADTYPAPKRDKQHPEFDAGVALEYDKALKRARMALYEQRNIVQRHLGRYEVVKSRNVALSEDALELVSFLSDGCLDRLAEVLVGISPILVDPKYVDGLQTSVLRVADQQKARLTESVSGYFVRRKPGVQKLSEELD